MDEILKEIKLRPHVSSWDDGLLMDFIQDAKVEVFEYCNLENGFGLNEKLRNVIKEIAIVKLNKMGAEGLSTEGGASSLSQNYIDGYPAEITKKLQRIRRLPR